MPSDALTVAVTAGLGVSVLAGILSGICYILTQGLPRKRNRGLRTPWNCNVCGGQFRSIQGILEVEKVVSCAKCKEKVCRIKCSRRDPLRGWICQVCQQPEAWFKGLLKAIHPHKGWYRTSMNPGTIDELDEDLLELRKKEREQVRDFIERLVESMLGGNLDDVSVSRIYNDKKYDALFVRYHADLSNALTDLGSALHISISNLPITGQSPCSAHASLKQLIQRFIREAVDLPELKKKCDHPALPEEAQEDRTYEDLLSTAIINKVVRTYQDETTKSSTNSSRASGSNRTNGGKEYFFSEETLETKWKNRDAAHDDTSSSISSVDDWAKSDSSVGSSKYIDRVSLTIKQRIDEDTTSEDEAPENVNLLEKNAMLQSDDAWNENWYLQKRVLGTNSPVPVPMLVPNPTTEAKVLIGDRDAEDTSDLSDAASDFGEPELAPDIKNILVNSKRIIGGKNLIDDAIDENVSLVNSDVDINNTNANAPQLMEDKVEELNVQCLVDLEEPVDKMVIANDVKNIGVTRSISNDENIRSEENVIEAEDISLLSLDSNTEQDTEYTEQYASLPRTILKSPKPTPRSSKLPEIVQLFETNSNETNNVDEKLHINSELLQNTNESYSGDDELGIFKGSYSEREKEKWKHAVEMPNNPYSPENLERRISRSSDDSSNDKFDRDYYIKEAARSAGSRKLLNNAFITETSGTDPSNDFNTEEDPIKINGNSGAVVKAIPATVEPEEGTQFTFPTDVPVSSDSDMSIERIYNLESGKVTQKIGDECEEYTVTLGERSRATDENHNTYDVNEKKREFMRSLTLDEPASNDVNDALRSPDIVKRLVPYPNNKPPVLDQELIDKYDEDLKGDIVENVTIEENVTSKENVTTKENVVVPYLETEDVIKYNAVVKHQGHVNNQFEAIIKSQNHIENLAENKTTPTTDFEDDAKEFSLEYSTDEGQSRPESSLDPNPEIQELKSKSVVKDILGKFSKSYPNLSTTETKRHDDMKRTESVEQVQVQNEIKTPVYEEEIEVPSVRNLKKLFDKENIDMQSKKDQVHSLTARSISKQFRQELKSHEENITHDETLPNGISNDAQDEDVEELPADITKKGIAYFENLGKRK